MVLMKKKKNVPGLEILHHGKPLEVGDVVDVDKSAVGRFKDAGFEESVNTTTTTDVPKEPPKRSKKPKKDEE